MTGHGQLYSWAKAELTPGWVLGGKLLCLRNANAQQQVVFLRGDSSYSVKHLFGGED